MAHASTHDDFIDDAEIRDSIRTMQRARSWRLVGVVVALVSALVLATVYAYLSYSDHAEAPVPAQGR